METYYIVGLLKCTNEAKHIALHKKYKYPDYIIHHLGVSGYHLIMARRLEVDHEI